MNFVELRFWGHLLSGLFLVLACRVLFARLAPTRLQAFDKTALLFLGLFLLLSVSWITFLIFLAVAIGTYGGLAWIQRYHAQHALKYLWILIPLQLAPLFYYKYADFIGNSLLGLNSEALRGLIIPVGISFYTFQKVAFVVDTLVWDRPRPRFLDYMNFAGFFPQIVAGPIERRQDLLPQMEKFQFRWRPSDINEGARWMAVGFFFKCCLADNLSTFFTGGEGRNVYVVWIDNVMFGLRIYYDFAGYSLLAVGLAQCFGVRLTLNFASPYSSTSVIEFWRRWHITLSQWFRDYVYVPLGGGRVRFWAVNVVVVFILSGVWHGAGWNFVLWGALHAALLIANRALAKVPLPKPGAWFLTMASVFFTWLCFYERDTTVLLAKMQLLLTPGAYRIGAMHEALNIWSSAFLTMFIGVLTLTAATLLLEWLSLRRRGEPYWYLRTRVGATVLVILTVLLTPAKDNGFIYFAF